METETNYIMEQWELGNEVLAVPHQAKPFIVCDSNHNADDYSTHYTFDHRNDKEIQALIESVSNAYTHQGLRIARVLREYVN